MKSRQPVATCYDENNQLWDSQLRLGIISDENKQKLTEWMLYAAIVGSTMTSACQWMNNLNETRPVNGP
ncbi:hypothetical protein IPCEC42_31290 [Escherichia coli]|nr:hypothetical protein IPCEC42_31290 [Escherichia coli]